MNNSRRFKSEAVTREQLKAIDSMHVPSHCITNNGQVYALAYSSTSAKRIANALNIYNPKRRRVQQHDKCVSCGCAIAKGAGICGECACEEDGE